MVMAHCLVQKISAAEPGEAIHLVAPPATAPVARRMHEITQVHSLATEHGEFGLRKRWRLGRQLAAERFDRAYVLPNSWKSALLPWFAQIPRRSGWLGEFRHVLLNDTAPLPADVLPLMIERFIALQDVSAAQSGSLERPYPQPTLGVDEANQARLFAEHQLDDAGGAVALCPGAEFGAAKRWPAAHFSAVAKELLAHSIPVWLLGGPADVAVCDEIVAAVRADSGSEADRLPINLAGKTRLADAIDLLAAVRAVVCNDSGLMHVASAVDTPVVALYGSTSADFTPPLHPAAQALSLVTLDGGAARLDCQPCFQRTCRFGHSDCLNRLMPAEVVRALKQQGLPL